MSNSAVLAANPQPGTPRFGAFSSGAKDSIAAASPEHVVVPKIKAKKSSIIANALSGTIGSILAEALLFPVDTVKLRVQTAARSNGAGFLHTLAAVLRESGVKGLYRGIGGALIKESVHSFNYWILHATFFRVFTEFDDTSRTPSTRRLLLNLMSKQLNWLCTVPFEVVSNVNQVSPGSPGFVATALELYKEGGIGRFYRGLAVSLLLAVNPAIMNTLITSLLRIRAAMREAQGADHLEAREHGAMVVGTATALSKMIATILTYPLIRAKVLQQTASSSLASASFGTVLRKVFVSDGVAGLYQGILAMSYKTILWNSMMMAFKHILGPKRAITPPASPKPANPLDRRMPFMAREPFPVEYTQEKLDELLFYLRGGHAVKKVEVLEKRLDEATHEIREVRKLLAEFLSKTDSSPRANPNVT